jgi:hypothetical protein
MELIDADHRRLARWDADVDRTVNGTLFHRLDFLGYHGDRFAGVQRNLVLLDGEEPFAWLSLALDGTPTARTARSPFGGSYGSFAFASYPTYAKSRETVEALLSFLNAEGVDCCLLTPPLSVCAAQPLDTFHFALLESGFTSVKRDLSSVVGLGGPMAVDQAVSSAARWRARKAERAGISLLVTDEVDRFWPLVEAAYWARGRATTHTRDQLAAVAGAVPGRLLFHLGLLRDQPVGGLARFVVNDRVAVSFYLCQDPAFADTQALSLVLLAELAACQAKGFTHYDLGTSTVEGRARTNVLRFKESYSKTAVFRETFGWVRREPVGAPGRPGDGTVGR